MKSLDEIGKAAFGSLSPYGEKSIIEEIIFRKTLEKLFNIMSKGEYSSYPSAYKTGVKTALEWVLDQEKNISD